MPAKENLLFPILFHLGRRLPFRWLQKGSGLPVIPLYHAVSDEPSPYVKHVGVWRSTQQFREDLEFLLRHYEPVGLADLKTGRKTRKPPLHLTFDDGLRECYTNVFPLLREKGVPATFFINSAFVGNKELFFRYQCSLIIEKVESEPAALNAFLAWIEKQEARGGWKPFLLSVRYANRAVLRDVARVLGIGIAAELKRSPCYMSLEELQRLEREGFSIGAHSIDHPRYDGLPLAEQLRQTRESLAFVGRNFNQPVRTFAFPFTDFGVARQFFEALKKEEACDLSFGCAGLKRDEAPGHLQRIPFDENPYSARMNLSKEYLYFLLKAPLRKNTFKR